MQLLFRIVILWIVTAGAVWSSEKSDVMASVHRLVDAFNKGDSKAFLAACSDQTSIIDEISPHEWHGTGGCSKWMSDYAVYVEKTKVADAVTTLGNPKRIIISADNAYVVVPAKCVYKQFGKPVNENVVVTVTLHKDDSGWQLTGWTWARL
jgi:hypothetical protein